MRYIKENPEKISILSAISADTLECEQFRKSLKILPLLPKYD